MTDKISQLVDQELDSYERDALIERISNDEVARKAWKSYHLIGNVMRGEASVTSESLTTLLRNRLNEEPILLVPMSVEFTRSTSPTKIKTNLWKSVGMFSMVASLMLVAVMTLNPLNSLHTNEHTVSLDNSIAVISGGNVDQTSYEFDEMLITHAEFVASHGINGLAAYARMVSVRRLER